MIDISLDPSLAVALPDFVVGVVEADSVTVTEHDAGLWAEIDARLAEIGRTLRVEDIAAVPQIAGLRKAYRTLGKDPTRYRGSQEALLRRVLKGKGLYHVNTVVDINNLVSMESCHSLGTFDMARIDGPVVIRAGLPGETYYGIGRDLLNVEGLPLLCDRQGPFGSPTSDSERTKVTLETTSTLTAVLSFVGPEKVADYCRRVADLLCRYAAADGQRICLRMVTAAGSSDLDFA
ncbi:MAG TPA: phenylalanine--tRNA ligase beta subunit-related protein [Phycisphaerae bacterium]|nr:phenylalanine--tRNA ligase beta subunit-related protein [Phycisphaerae bacterium]HOJ75388.1 phenylalanine--tRNA ligase beta subunit-related protein [Phycisphaerae bacterium]HOM52628.1 phenylalanine--tRNA ligase beta subunit-related protein [Phycisphaerae bacterium]HON66642.1 phenylalanine--tRNA ligase beta subunit-related protein [Phycisphaerae bacterium]HOQ87142.1 phenylalanine--tRNA ligase beta subunit-related protein [Phycisphaerae bacterium]